MGQNLMNWTMAAGSLFEEQGTPARDRRHASAAREDRAQQTQRSRPNTLAALTAFASFASLYRSRPANAHVAECCAAA